MANNKPERIILVVLCWLSLIPPMLFNYCFPQKILPFGFDCCNHMTIGEPVPPISYITLGFLREFSLLLLLFHAIFGFFSIQGKKIFSIIFGVVMLFNGLFDMDMIFIAIFRHGYRHTEAYIFLETFKYREYAVMATVPIFLICGYRLARMGLRQDSSHAASTVVSQCATTQLVPRGRIIEKCVYVLPFLGWMFFFLNQEIAMYVPQQKQVIRLALLFSGVLFLGTRILMGKRLETYCFAAYSIYAGINCLTETWMLKPLVLLVKYTPDRMLFKAVPVASAFITGLMILCLLGGIFIIGGIRLIWIDRMEQLENKVRLSPPDSLQPQPGKSRLTKALALKILRIGLILCFLSASFLNARHTLFARHGSTPGMIIVSGLVFVLAVSMAVLMLKRFRFPSLVLGFLMLFTGGIHFLIWIWLLQRDPLGSMSDMVLDANLSLVFIAGGCWFLASYARESRMRAQGVGETETAAPPASG